jgi:hypothetical protein
VLFPVDLVICVIAMAGPITGIAARAAGAITIEGEPND